MEERTRIPLPIVVIEIMGYVGVAFWLSMILRSAAAADGSLLGTIIVGLILGAAHVAISVGARRHSRVAFAAMWFVLVGDTVLALVIDPRAWALVLFTIVLLGLTLVPSARAWFAPNC